MLRWFDCCRAVFAVVAVVAAVGSGRAATDDAEPFRVAIIEVPSGLALDLDRVAAVPGGSVGAEIANGPEGLEYLVRAVTVAEGEPALPWISDAPWRSLSTSEARSAWVQVLRDPGATPRGLESPRWPVAEVRIVVAPPGRRTLPGCPGDPCCIGSAKRIDVWFDPVPGCSHYRVERRSGADGAYGPAVDVVAPPYSDNDVQPGVRYGYRITGVSAATGPSLPAEVQGTTASGGVRHGRLDVVSSDVWPATLDVVGDRVLADSTSGDVCLLAAGTTTYWMLRPTGRYAMHPARVNGLPLSPWTAHDMPWTQRYERAEQLVTRAWECAEVRGGGVVLLRAVQTTHPKWYVVHVEYIVDTDRPAFRKLHDVSVSADGSVARIRVTAPAGWRTESVEVLDLISGAARPPLAAKDGLAVDPAGGDGALLQYTPVVFDARGRRQFPVAATLNRLEGGLRAGEFTLLGGPGDGRGFSFAAGRTTLESESCDIAYSKHSGAGATVTLDALGGQINVARATGWTDRAADADALYDSVIGVVPDEVPLVTRCSAERPQPESEVFVVRVAGGGWAKFVVVDRKPARSARERPEARIRYTYNPRGSELASGAVLRSVHGGIQFGTAAAGKGPVPPR